jgi:hypothetical protein
MKCPKILIAAALAAVAVAVPAQAHEQHEHHGGERVGPHAVEELKEARTATKRFRTVSAAKAAGYVLDTECVADPAAGGMGFHAFNETLMADGKLDPRRPEILVYAKNRYGRLRLVALEYFAADPDGDPSTDDRPRLFGQRFDGPISGPGGAPIYLLHAWVHKRNPSGTFAPFNPRVSC